jgi:FkbH-like protein
MSTHDYKAVDSKALTGLNFETLLDIIRYRAKNTPKKIAYMFVLKDKVTNITYKELDDRARAIGSYLVSIDATGKCVLLMLSPGFEFISSFFGCLYAGVIAVPVCPPRHEQHFKSINAIAADSNALIALTDGSIEEMFNRNNMELAELTKLRRTLTQSIPNLLNKNQDMPRTLRNDIAYLQYTSGSTGNPKGVMVVNDNILYNLKYTKEAFGLNSDSILVSWLPPFHNMGLIGGLIQPLYTGFFSVIMPPEMFLQNPYIWLKTISKNNATISGGPNFAYDVCVNRITSEQINSLDLSTWKVAFSGSEPVRKETIDRFTEKFKLCGFRRESFCACYGLAESTLFVTGSSTVLPPREYVLERDALTRNEIVLTDNSSESSQVFIGCGKSPAEQSILIVDPQTMDVCAPGQIGEIWVSGKSIAKGYWLHLHETKETFYAKRKDSADGSFLRTGDLGFLQNEDLVVTGRLKDLIIINGKNYYPQDIERTAAESHETLRQCPGAAFAVDIMGAERLVVVHEIKLNATGLEDVIHAIRNAVAVEFGLQVYAVVLIKEGTLPQTVSGKVMHKAAKEAYCNNHLDIIRQNRMGKEGTKNHRDESTQHELNNLNIQGNKDWIANCLKEMARQTLHIQTNEIGQDESLMMHGMDSLKSYEMVQKIEDSFHVTIPVARFLEGCSLREIACMIQEISRDIQSQNKDTSLQAFKNSSHKLSEEQKRFWYLDKLTPGNPAYHVPSAVLIKGSLDKKALEYGLNKIVERHQILRSRITAHLDEPEYEIVDQYIKIKEYNICSIPFDQRQEEERRLVIQEMQRAFDLEEDLLLRAALICRDKNEYVLVFVMHHIVSDLWSLSVLYKELSDIYNAYATDTPLSLPELTVQYADYTAWLQDSQTDEWIQPRIEFWKRRLAGIPMLDLPGKKQTHENLQHKGGYVFSQLSDKLYENLRKFCREQGYTLNMVCLAAFSMLLYRYCEQDDFGIGVPVFSRSKLELQKLIGLFANTLVLRIDMSGNPGFIELLNQIRSALLESYENSNVPFGRLVQELNPERIAGRNPLCQVMFSYNKDPLDDIYMTGLTLEHMKFDSGYSDFELFMTVIESKSKVNLQLGYDETVFDAELADRMTVHFKILLQEVIDRPDETVLSLTAEIPQLNYTIAVAATFTAEPVEQSLKFWSGQLGIHTKIHFAPYNQVLQTLLDKDSVFSNNSNGVNVLLVRFDDWLRYGMNDSDIEHQMRLLRKNTYYMAEVLKSATVASLKQFILCICPYSSTNTELTACSRELEVWLCTTFSSVGCVQIITPDEIDCYYPVCEKYDTEADNIGHIPYTPQMYTALGTIVARKISALQTLPVKVIVLDCDQTLWDGVCAEDGPFGVEISEPRKKLQELMLECYNSGVLLCLCSKNDESDVLSVFHNRTDMPLKLHHFLARRINWKPKSENIRLLADELHLGLEDFVFFDDSIVECAEVESNCPGVRAFPLPESKDEVVRFLQHIWIFNIRKTTSEDYLRGRFYWDNIERERILKNAPSFQKFLDTLELLINITPMKVDQVQRVAQLTERVNQFNTSAVRRTAEEIIRMCGSSKMECSVVEVKDRFGDYGLVGAILFRRQHGILDVDTLLLSCRVLGRGVEYQVLMHLAHIAQKNQLEWLQIRYDASSRNRPVYDFLREIDAEYKEFEDFNCFLISSAKAVTLKFEPKPYKQPDVKESTGYRKDKYRMDTQKLLYISKELNDITKITNAVSYSNKKIYQNEQTPYAEPETPIEKKVAEIWSEFLGIKNVGVNDHFFDLGGYSLLATQIISKIRDVFEVQISVNEFLRGTTVKSLSAIIEESIIEQSSEEDIQSILQEIESLSNEEVAAMLQSNEELKG